MGEYGIKAEDAWKMAEGINSDFFAECKAN